MEETMLQALEGSRERCVTTPRPALVVARLPCPLPFIAAHVPTREGPMLECDVVAIELWLSGERGI
eukprot:9472157-Pyramimonas_sp.AAC.1